MRAAILSAGPSLTKTFDPDIPYNIKLAVNSAVELVFCTHWIFIDQKAFRYFMPLNDARPIICTSTTAHDNLMADDGYRQRYTEHRCIDIKKGIEYPPQNYTTFTVLAAMCAAAHLGATSIDMYGDDKAGHIDCRGIKHGNRGDDRWNFESEILHHDVMPWLKARKIAVEWHRDDITSNAT